MNSVNIITLATCFNRSEKTINCLEILHKVVAPECVNIEHVIVDDRSTDGTPERIKTLFPSVTLLSTNGDCYWAGGMRFGWDNLVCKKQFDYLIVYNDDGDFFLDVLEGYIELLVSGDLSEDSIYVGGFNSIDDAKVTYGGRVRRTILHPLFTRLVIPSGKLEKVDNLNMNFAIIPNKILNSIGFLSKDFKHGQADFDYGLRACENNIDIYLLPYLVGRCDHNNIAGTSLERGISLRERFKRLVSIKEQPVKQLVALYRGRSRLWPIFVLLPFLKIIIAHIGLRFK